MGSGIRQTGFNPSAANAPALQFRQIKFVSLFPHLWNGGNTIPSLINFVGWFNVLIMSSSWNSAWAVGSMQDSIVSSSISIIVTVIINVNWELPRVTQSSVGRSFPRVTFVIFLTLKLSGHFLALKFLPQSIFCLPWRVLLPEYLRMCAEGGEYMCCV